MPQFSSKFRPVVVVALALAVVGAAGAWALSAPQEEAKPGALDQQIRRLLEERLQLIQRVVKDLEAQYKNGVVPLDTVLAAREARCRAELDLCTTRAARIKVHESMVALARRTETLITEQVASGTASTTDALRVRVKRIEAEVELLRAKRK